MKILGKIAALGVEAGWLSEPSKDAGAYVTRDGLMYVQVTTIDPADMKFAE